MAFRELMEGMKIPDGAGDRYRKLEALGRMLTGELYEDLPFDFSTEKGHDGKYLPLRKRRPSVDFNLAYEITQDTLAELFGDEQFPAVQLVRKGEQLGEQAQILSDLIDAVELQQTICDVYEEGVVGGVGVVVRRSDDGLPFYEILPAKWCEPVYRSAVSTQLAALVVTYPITPEEAEDKFPGITKEKQNEGATLFWYRYVVGPAEEVEYRPLPAHLFKRLGEVDEATKAKIEFAEHKRTEHGFKSRTPAIYAKNLGGKQREIDGPALWWPIRNMCVEIDYTLSQAGRGLRYCADPMLFLRKGDLDNSDVPAGYESTAAGGMAEQVDADGSAVRGASQILVGRGKDADAKVLEISAQGITEEREFVRDLREYALEVLGGMKARAEHLKSAPSGAAIDKGLKPLRRLVRRQRRPYGNRALLELLDLTIYGIEIGALDAPDDVDVKSIPYDAKRILEWPNDDTLQGQELLYHVEGLQMAAGGSPQKPLQLIKPEVVGAKLSSDLGSHEPYDAVKGSLEAAPSPPPQPIVTP